MTINEVIYELNHRPNEIGFVVRSFYRDSSAMMKDYIPIAISLGCLINKSEHSFKFPNNSTLFFSWCETREDAEKFRGMKRTKFCYIDLVNYELQVELYKLLD